MSQPPRILHSDESFAWRAGRTSSSPTSQGIDVIRVKRIGQPIEPPEHLSGAPSPARSCGERVVVHGRRAGAPRSSRSSATDIAVAVVIGITDSRPRWCARRARLERRHARAELTLFASSKDRRAIEPLVVPARKGDSVRKELLAAILAVRIDYRARHAPPSAQR
jgi:hypothetical protein